jgi:molybdate transport system ATP-binding protein
VLIVETRSRIGSFQLDVRLTAPPGTVTVLVGESGSGKSTLLRVVAGLLSPDEGRVTLDGVALTDRAAGVLVPPESRPVGYVAQDYALFPHLSVAENVAFGPRSLGLPGSVIRDRTGRALERFDLAAFATRKPHQLSGGQQQRVALARALVLDPAILLLDEPLSALDLLTRRAVRTELRSILAGLSCVTLFVTHQPSEALALGDQITVLEAGQITQSGGRADFVRHPRSRYVAEFLGVNLLVGTIWKPGAEGLAVVDLDGSHLVIPDPGVVGPVRLVVRPDEIVVSRETPSGSARNVLRGAIQELVPEPPSGDQVRLLLASRPPLAALVTHASVEALGLRPGTEVYASFKATAVRSDPP